MSFHDTALALLSHWNCHATWQAVRQHRDAPGWKMEYDVFSGQPGNTSLPPTCRYGFVVMDGNGSLFGTVSGNTREVSWRAPCECSTWYSAAPAYRPAAHPRALLLLRQQVVVL